MKVTEGVVFVLGICNVVMICLVHLLSYLLFFFTYLSSMALLFIYNTLLTGQNTSKLLNLHLVKSWVTVSNIVIVQIYFNILLLYRTYCIMAFI